MSKAKSNSPGISRVILPKGLTPEEAIKLIDKDESLGGPLNISKTPQEIEEIASSKVKRDEPLNMDTLQVIGFINAVDKTLKGLRQHKLKATKEDKKGIDILIKHLELTRKEGLTYPPYKYGNWYFKRVLMFWGLDQHYPVLEEDKGKFKRSGHLTDQILKYNYPKSGQYSIWDSLQDSTQKDIQVKGVERTEVVEGIKLSPSETKIIDCLCKLLHEGSQTLEPTKEGYYAGNLTPELVEYGEEKTPAPKLAFTLYELTKEYKGGEAISGKDVENVKQILTELNSRQFLIRYTETIKGKKGEWIKKEYEAFRRLLDVDKATLSSGIGDIEHYKKTETVILLNPIFRRQIDSKFILYPNDINQRTIIAYGSHNISDIAMRLRDYLMRELSSKHYQPEIGQDKLYYLLAEKWMREGRKKKVKDYTEKALEVVTNLGLLESYKTERAKTTGEPKVVFSLNKKWE